MHTKPYNEKSTLDIGIMPLTDSAPFVVAKERGLFKKWGLDVNLHKQNSWVGLRDKLQSGLLDAGHLLAPMPLACSLGLGGNKVSMITPFVLSRNGNAITISEKLCAEIIKTNDVNSVSLPLVASALTNVIEQRIQSGRKLKFATVYPYSCHYYQLLSWFQQSRIDLSNIDILIIPPNQMVEALKADDIDGFCVGGPWNAKAVRQGIGITGLTSSDIWPDFPEKVLCVTQSWQQNFPVTTLSLIKALQESCDWLQHIPNRFEAAKWLATPEYLDTDIDIVAPSLLGSCLTQSGKDPRFIPAYNQFSVTGLQAGNCPDWSYGEWLLNQMCSAGHLQASDIPLGFVQTVYRADIYQQVSHVVDPSEKMNHSGSDMHCMSAK